MSMLARFKKPGGFEQLRTLLETSAAKKRETLFKAIEGEDKEMAALLRASLLSYDKVITWDPTILGEVTARLGDKIIAILAWGKSEDIFNKLTHTHKEMKKRDIKNIMEGLKVTPVEFEVAEIKLIEKVREAEKEGVVRLDKDGKPQVGAMKVA